MSELSDYKRMVEQPLIEGYKARIKKLDAYSKQLEERIEKLETALRYAVDELPESVRAFYLGSAADQEEAVECAVFVRHQAIKALKAEPLTSNPAAGDGGNGG